MKVGAPLRLAFTHIPRRLWAGGYNYQSNLFAALGKFRPGEFTPVLFAGTGNDDADLAPLAAIAGVEVVRSPAFEGRAGLAAAMALGLDRAAAAEFQRALDLNPNFAAAHGYLGWALAFGGQSEQAIAHLKEAIRMSPHDPQNAIFNTGLAIAHYLAGRFAEAVEYSRETLQQRSAFTAGHRIHCASLAQNGQIDEAREALARLKEAHPDLSIAWIESNIPYTAAPMAKFVEGMRKAGLQ